jgi:phosphatidylglycerophosphate synthase
LRDPAFGVWDSVVNNIIPIVIISISSLVLVIRVYYQKRRLHQPNVWRKQRKMTVQLLCSSVLYLIPNMPLNIFVIAHLCGLSANICVQIQLYFDFLGYFVILLYPFVCFGSLSELRKKMKWRKLFLLQQPRQIAIVRPQ